MPRRRQTRLANAAMRAERDARIFTRMQQGLGYDTIAEEESLSRERVRQIITDALDRRDGAPSGELRRLQLARLDPALRLAAEKVGAGDLRAIDKLVRVLNQMDKYREGPARRGLGFIGEREESEEDARERIMRKLSDVDARRAAAEEDEGEATRDSADLPADDSVSKFFALSR